MNVDYSEQLKFAHKAHNSIPPGLWESPVILKAPDERIFHSLKFPSQTDEHRQAEAQLLDWYSRKGTVFHVSELPRADAAKKHLRWGVPYFGKFADDPAEDFTISLCEQNWVGSPHHDLTMEMSGDRIIPANIGAGCPSEVISLATVMRDAQMRGHQIPESFFQRMRPISGAEINAYCAARDLVYRQRALTSDFEHAGSPATEP